MTIPEFLAALRTPEGRIECAIAYVEKCRALDESLKHQEHFQHCLREQDHRMDAALETVRQMKRELAQP